LETEYSNHPKTLKGKREPFMAKKRKTTAKKKTGAKRKSGLTQTTYSLSPELQAVVGAKSLTRPQVVKKLWAYIKAHKCQDTKNRRLIVPDKKLCEVIGKKPVDMLKLAGLLSKHIK
jgi:chromatin remodeling complex protein RSC6